MEPPSVEFNPHPIETEVLALWKARRLPPAGGVLGPPAGPTVRQFAGSFTPGDFPALVTYRAVLADVEARYLALAGRRVSGTLRQGVPLKPMAPSAIPPLLTALGVWTGGDGRAPWDAEDRTAPIQAIVARLAQKEILITHDEAFRICPSCGTLRSPERIVYDEQEGDTYLVRFPMRIRDLTVNALVWVDAPWKLLGTSALLLNPTLPYVVAGYRRRDDRELVLTSRPSLDRLRSWIPESVLEVVEERPGREYHGTPYAYPLRHEFPMGGELTPPAGTLLAAADVGESGTGIVPLVPGHGPTDTRIADRLGVTGWPLLTPAGRLDFTLMHKYAGLDLETANEFVVRDLSEAGALLARLRVKRGVPYCSICGTALLWAPARAWCLEPSRLPAERRALFSRALPHDSFPGQGEVAPWPVSDSGPSDDPNAVALLECTHCERLDAPDGPRQCACGASRAVVRRKILPSIGAALAAWARTDPFPEGDSVHLYVGQRRRVPVFIHHLAALSGVEGTVGDVSVTVVPTGPAADLPELVGTYGADVVRSAVVRSGASESAGARFDDLCRRELDRFRRWWGLSREVVALCDRATIAELARPISGYLSELETEDRAIVARWERTRILALAQYDHGSVGLVHRRVASFLDNELVEYREMVQPRLVLSGTPPTKRAALRTLVHLLRSTSEVLAPIVPFFAEAIHRAVSAERTSLFERPMGGVDRALQNDDLVAAWDRWRSLLRSVSRFRRSFGLPRSTVLPSLVLVVPADDVADRLRAEKEVIARLARVQRVDVGSPRNPWKGRQRVLRPVDAEIQRVYPTQAAQIIHLLQRLTPRSRAGPSGEEELSVVVDSYPLRIFPSMVSIVETLPKGVVPVPWPLGEMYAGLPVDAAAGRASLPPLSSDAFWLVRRLERRLRGSPPAPGQAPRVALVTVKDPLASELRSAASPVARYLGLGELRVVERAEEAVPPNAVTGRTRTGDRWWVHVPGLPAPPARAKRPHPMPRLQRVRVTPPAPLAEAVDYADQKVVAREEAVRALGQELDDIVGIPLLGPAKISVAWDQGLQSVADLRQAPFATVSALPGFGGPVAEVVVTKIGGTVPPRSARAGRPLKSEGPPFRVFPAVPPSPPAGPPRLAGAGPTESELRPPVAPPTPSPTEELAPPAAPLPPAPPSPGPTESAVEPPAPPSPGPTESAVEPPAPPSPGPTESAVEPPASVTPVAEPPAPAPEITAAEPVPAPGPAPEAPPLETAEEGAREPGGGPEPIAPLSEEPTSIPEPTVRPGAVEEAELPLAPEEHPLPAEPEETGTQLREPEPVAPVELLETPSVAPAPEAAPLTTEEVAPSVEEVPSPPPPEEETTPIAETSAPEVTAAPAEAATLVEEAPPPPPPEEENPPPVEPLLAEEIIPATEPVVPPPTAEAAPPLVSPVVEEQPEAPPPGAEAPPEGPLVPPEEPEAAPAPATEVAAAVASPEVPSPTPQPVVEPEATEEPLPEPEVPPAPPVGETPPPVAPGTTVPPPTPIEEASAPSVPIPPTSPPPEVPPPAAPLPPEPSVVPVSPPSVVAPPAPEVPVVTVLPPAPAVPVPVEPPPPPSGVELTFGESLFVALAGFLDSTAAGHHGVCVVRESPERIRARVGSRPIEVFWLSNIGRGPSLRPADLEGLWTFLSRKLTEAHATAFFLEGIEYLVRLHGVDAVLTGLVQFDRLARESDARVWVCITPALMRTTDLERFRATFGSGSEAR